MYAFHKANILLLVQTQNLKVNQEKKPCIGLT